MHLHSFKVIHSFIHESEVHNASSLSTGMKIWTLMLISICSSSTTFHWRRLHLVSPPSYQMLLNWLDDLMQLILIKNCEYYLASTVNTLRLTNKFCSLFMSKNMLLRRLTSCCLLNQVVWDNAATLGRHPYWMSHSLSISSTVPMSLWGSNRKSRPRHL